jgi:hypothetical protein
MRSLILTLAVCLAPLTASAASSATVKGTDIYRSPSLTLDKINSEIQGRLYSYLALRTQRKRGVEKPAERIKAEIEDMLTKKFGLAYVEVNYNEYATSAARTAYVTYDVVEKADAAARMPFRGAPKSKTLDPEGLLAAWQQFTAAGDALVREGKLDSSNRPNCPGHYCTYPATTPELAQLEKRIAAGVLGNRKLLDEARLNDADASKRAAAVYVLSYLPDGKEAAAAATEALTDPSAEVRSAGLQVLSDIALYDKAVLIDLGKLIAVLDYPAVSDRTKALSVVVGLVDNPAYRPLILQRALPSLLALLRLKQPSNHDLAFTVLSTLSQENYGRRDYAAWTKWAEKQSSGPVAELPGVSVDDAP